MARPKTLQMRVTEEEYDVIEKKAKSLGLTISNYMRMVCLHVKIDFSIQPSENESEN
ncbi:MAG: hypothetical protein N4A54_04120 [Peptostreptococcaceae bacterium]|jgi:uncharacterized protein (DUF1778 family)|nr:hypothetical protein [Peptostreptococcaceae bacterium]